MAIKQSDSFNWRLPSWLLQCDYCGAQTQKTGIEPGDAAEVARKEGFSTVSIRPELPMKWQCRNCATNNKANGKGARL